MDTLLKWPGGKGREFPQVRPYISPFQTYAEPFFGGGAFFFNLTPHRSLLNDVNARLVGLYACVREANFAFEEAVIAYVDAWEGLQKTINDLQAPLLKIYHDARAAAPSTVGQVAHLLAGYGAMFVQDFATFMQDFATFIGDPVRLWETISFQERARFSRAPSCLIPTSGCSLS